MIITRSPLRITLGGGGTDLPSYYRHFGGSLIAAAIDKYVYITLHTTSMLLKEFVIKYSKLERVDSIEKIKHPIIREALKYVKVNVSYLEMASIADISAGTGLGSSGSFTTAFLKALYTLNKDIVSPYELASSACKIELDILKEPIGKQDQYIASFGGITSFEFLKNGKIQASPLKLKNETVYNLEDNLLLFFTGYSRSASGILEEQDKKSKKMDPSMIENLHFIKSLGEESKQSLLDNDLKTFAKLMNQHWEHKKKRSLKMSNDKINACYEAGLKNGAIGGKMIGAGGGGFLMFYANDKIKLRSAMKKHGLHELRFKFDYLGTQVLSQ